MIQVSAYYCSTKVRYLAPPRHHLVCTFASHLYIAIVTTTTTPCTTPRIRSHSISRSRFAPYFSRGVDVFEDFLEDFEDHANACKLSDSQRVDAIVRYIDPSSHEFCESGIGFRSRDWISFGHIRVLANFFGSFRMTYCSRSVRRS